MSYARGDWAASQIESDNHGVVQLSVIVIVLICFTSILCFLIRGQLKISFAAEDCWLLLSLLFFHGYLGLVLWSKRCARVK